MLTELSHDPLLDQEFEGHHRAERVLNSEVSYVRYLISWITKTFDYINRFNLTLLLSVYEGTWTHSSPLVSMHILDRSCMIVGGKHYDYDRPQLFVFYSCISSMHRPGSDATVGERSMQFQKNSYDHARTI